MPGERPFHSVSFGFDDQDLAAPCVFEGDAGKEKGFAVLVKWIGSNDLLDAIAAAAEDKDDICIPQEQQYCLRGGCYEQGTPVEGCRP